MEVDWLGSILALLTAAAGWFYLFYSRAAAHLADYEQERTNRRRGFLRRVGGAVMLLMGVGLYIGLQANLPRQHPRWFVGIWLSIMALMGLLVVLALIDVRLTLKLRRRQKAEPPAVPVSPSDQTPNG